MNKNKILRIIPIGGLGEVGKNMTLYEYGNNILIVDAGLMFPENDMLGIDYIIPDFEHYLKDKRDQVRGMIFTHGHEDHIGAVQHLLEMVNAPIYATKLTLGLLEVKLSRYGMLAKADLRPVNAGEQISIGPFTVDFFHVCHSIPDGVGLGIETPAGLVVHTGDYKLTIRRLTTGPQIMPNWLNLPSVASWRCWRILPTPRNRAGRPPSVRLREPSTRSLKRLKAHPWPPLPH